MIENRYAKIIDEETHEVQVGVGCSNEYYEEIGMVLMDVERADNGNYYLAGFVPTVDAVKETPEMILDNEQIRLNREYLYKMSVDPITAHIQRLRDEEQTEEIVAEINQLIQERKEKVAKIRLENPYVE